jgi:hypothetical protein
VNERINQLAEQAVSAVQNRPNGTCDMDKYNQKFAELIVKECMRLCEHESNDDQYDEYDMGMEAKAGAIRETLKEHFGVK